MTRSNSHDSTGWTAADVPDQTGRTVLITGANSGLGFEMASVLAARGARVLMACRNRAKGEAAAEAVAAGACGAPPELIELDLGDLASVRSCAGRLVARREQLDVLALNAGVMDMPRSQTADGFETHFGTNHLGHFALAGLLAPLIAPSPSARLLVTSSVAHRAGRIRWQDPNWTGRFYNAFLAYAQSKLANLLFMREVERRARAAGLSLISVGAHPGATATNLATQNTSRVNRIFYDAFHRYGTQPVTEGTRPLLYAATMPVEGGSYWGPTGLLELQGPAGPARPARAACDVAAAGRLWSLSEQLTGVTWSWDATTTSTARGDS